MDTDVDTMNTLSIDNYRPRTNTWMDNYIAPGKLFIK